MVDEFIEKVRQGTSVCNQVSHQGLGIQQRDLSTYVYLSVVTNRPSRHELRRTRTVRKVSQAVGIEISMAPN